MGNPDDKPKQIDAFEDPQLYVVVGEEVFPRTGLETALVDYAGENNSDENRDTGDTVGGVVCACNKVRVRSGCACVNYRGACACVGHKSCACVGHQSCSCVGHRKCSCVGHTSGGGSRSGCRCAPVH